MVEHVLSDSWLIAGWTGPLAIFGASALPTALLLTAWNSSTGRLPALALIGLWGGLLVASLIGHFPVPLLGYGASTVLGFGLALAMVSATPVGEGEG